MLAPAYISREMAGLESVALGLDALFKGGVHAAMVNNLIYNPGSRAVHHNLAAAEWAEQPHQTGQVALVGKLLRHGPDTRAAGACPWDRGTADQRLLADMAEGRGRIDDDETQAEGYPRHAPTQRRFLAADWHLHDMSPRGGWPSLFAVTRPR